MPGFVDSETTTPTIWECRVELSLSTRTEGDHTVLEVGGEIDVYTAPKLREQFAQLVEDGRYGIVVDLEKVGFLDSTGLGVLVGGLKKVRSHDGWLRLVCTQERILKIFRITGLDKVFPIHDSVAAALTLRRRCRGRAGHRSRVVDPCAGSPRAPRTLPASRAAPHSDLRRSPAPPRGTTALRRSTCKRWRQRRARLLEDACPHSP